MNPTVADKTEMQHLLFAELSRMFGREVPLYDKSLLVNKICNQTIATLLAARYRGFQLTEAQLEKTSGERHGAIRIGKPSEYRCVAGFFAAFGLEPHNYYDMTNLGGKSQPIVATAFRSPLHPEHRVFCSLLMTDYFGPQNRDRIEALLAPREVFSPRAQELIRKNQARGGLNWEEARELIAEGANRIFKWTGQARDHQLYQDLAAAGFKIAADIACFNSHHLNHLTPNTLWMDLYTAAMKFCLGELSESNFVTRAERALHSLLRFASRDYLKLHFKHLSWAQIEAFAVGEVAGADISNWVTELSQQLQRADLALQQLNHAGFKDFTEGPAEDTPVLLRQDSYKALTEPVQFHQPDGTVIAAQHTARFGEIEQRFYATTPKGRVLYDECLAAADAMKQAQPDLIKTDFPAYQAAYAQCFAPFPKTLIELLRQGLVYGYYTITPTGLAAAQMNAVPNVDLLELVERGYVYAEGVRYEDFLPISAAGIFASNLGQYGTKSTAATKPIYTQQMLEAIMGKPIIDANVTYHAQEAESLLTVHRELGILDRVAAEQVAEWKRAVARFHAIARRQVLGEANTEC
jgi:uncharacterized glyoxalase superfamily metalloenzyme YdcJ